MLHFVCCGILMFLMAIGEAKKCLAGCRVTNHNCTKCFSVLTAWVFWFIKKIGWTCCIKALYLGNGIMGACFQAPSAAPGQRQMEMLSWVDPDGLFRAPYNIDGNNKDNNNNNNNNNNFWQQKKDKK